jgi:hypothetical protein
MTVAWDALWIAMCILFPVSCSTALTIFLFLRGGDGGGVVLILLLLKFVRVRVLGNRLLFRCGTGGGCVSFVFGGDRVFLFFF